MSAFAERGSSEQGPDSGGGGPRVCVLAPAPMMFVEITGDDGTAGVAGQPTVHMHPGGQGIWVASMGVSLGATVSVCAPLGGELGEPVRSMLRAAGITVVDAGVGAGTGAAVIDLRGAERATVAHMPPPALGRHDLDDLYGMALVDALGSDVVVVTGVEPAGLVPPSFFARLVADVRAAGLPVVADLSGAAALAVIEEGPAVLKMSHEEVNAAGLAEDDDLDSLRGAAERMVEAGVGAVVISRAHEPTLLVTSAGYRLASGPAVRPVVHQGAGDSLTAGLAVGIGRGMAVTDALRLGTAAGTLNVTRRGLGSGRREQIERLAAHIEITNGERNHHGTA
ncbi:1-phosphofructokinase family hexose kinase [Demequina sp. SO4-13]|uniref:1-phosphofructokinase family hexose kinase n=1 Tax=Demequina sp. SO4-13 TaxID=3401027 RepID=UPI003AF58BD9